uniref:GAF domain-containing protein n=1 Tax=Promineifilum sp. TaxID=2664178 RepID=UPI0035B396B9
MTTSSDLIVDLQTLNQISQVLNQAADVQTALNTSLAQLVDLMGLETGWVFLRDPAAPDRWGGRGFRLAAHHNLPPAMAVTNPDAWDKNCDCQGLCLAGKLTGAYNEVRCSRLAGVTGERNGLTVHASSPLRAGDRILGILNVAAPGWSSFTPRSLTLLSTVGSQMGIALERARLFEALQIQRIHEQATLLDLSQQLLSRRDLDDLMNFLVDEVRELLKADACAVLLTDENDPDYLIFRAASGWHGDPVRNGYRAPADEKTGSGRVMRSQQILLVEDLSKQEPPLWMSEWLEAEGFRAAAIVPLVAANKSIGTLVIDSRQPRQFTDVEVRLLRLMANQAALAIEQARLHHEELQRQRIEEELAVGRQIQISMLPA